MIERVLVVFLSLAFVGPATAQPDYPVPCTRLPNPAIDGDSADLDGDGANDGVVFAPGRLTILRGTGDGTFTPWQEIELDALQGGFIDDIDGDGDADIVVIASDPAELIAFRLELDDTFAPFAASATSIGELDVLAPADLDGDGSTDLVYTHHTLTPSYQPHVVTRRGNGDGTFGPESSAPNIRTYLEIEVADFDADGRDDVVLGTDSTEEFELRLALPDGTLGPPSVLSTLPNPLCAANGDFSGDGVLDLVLVYATSPYARLQVGNGDGTFTDVGELETAIPAYDYQPVDFDGDGDLDLVSLGPERVALHVNGGGGSFAPGSTYFGEGSEVRTVELNGDGTPDFLLLGSYFVCSLLSNSGDGYAQNWEASAPASFGERIAFGLSSADGYGDLAAIVDRGDEVVTYHGGPHSVVLDQVFTVNGATDLSWHDLDGDGLDELIVAETAEHRLLVYWNLGGTLSAPEAFSVDYGPMAVAIGDVDEDGRPDLITANEGSMSISVLLALDGQAFALADDSPSMDEPTGLALADTNGDGHLDVIVSGSLGIYVHFGYGNGEFSSPAAPYTASTSALAAGDLDGDGRAEILGASFADVLVLLRSTGPTQFAAEAVSSPWRSGELHVADLDGDGRRDVIIVNEFGSLVGVHATQPDGSLSPAVLYLARKPRSIDVGDVNGDGATDIVAIARAVTTEGTVTVLPRFTTIVADPPRFLRGDTNQDGAVDIADPVELLGQLFGGLLTSCIEASDTNDDGARNVADAVYLLTAIFGGGPLPPAPYPGCGVDPTTDALPCLFHSACP